MDRLHRYNLHLKLPKCEFLKPEVVFLGLRISAEGLQPVEEKINAVKRAPVPQNVNELRSFLGMVQYYHSFLPGLGTILAPLHRLLQKNVRWEWSDDCKKAFQAFKEGLTSDSLLVHYDLNRKLGLACDASTKLVTGSNETKLVWNMRQHPCIFLLLFGYGYIFLLTYLQNTFSKIKKKFQTQSVLH